VSNYRISALGAVVALVAILGAIIVGVSVTEGIDSTSTPILAGLLAVISSTIPSILALIKVEQVHNDIKNGVVQDKVKAGTIQALREENIVTRDGPMSTTALDALAEILKATKGNSTKLDNLQEGQDNGRPSV
jgi:hypothetical protein